MQPHDSTSTQKSKLTNELHIVGRVATDLVQQGKGPTRFRLAHGGGGKKKNGEPWPVQFFSVSVWDKALVEGLSKGARVEISGKLRDSTFTTKDGTVKYGVEIVAEEILLEQAEPQPAPLTPSQITGTGGVAAARAILQPTKKPIRCFEDIPDIMQMEFPRPQTKAAEPAPQPNIHGVEVSDADIPF